MKTLAFALALSGCIEGGTCETPQQTGPGLTGAASYVLGDGSRMDSDLDRNGFARVAGTTVTLNASLVDVWGRSRSFDLDIANLTVGVFDLDRRGSACLPRMTGGPVVCGPLAGTIDVRAVSEECYWHESGVGACAETLDFTLHAQSVWEQTTLTVDGEMATVGEWVDEECAD